MRRDVDPPHARRAARSSTAPAMSLGMPRFVASRLAVPAGTMAIVAPVPASASMHRCAMPSPPQTKKWSAPPAQQLARPAWAPSCSSAPRPTAGRSRRAGRACGAARGRPPSMRLAGVGDDGDRGHDRPPPGARPRRAAAARPAIATTSAPMPTSSPAATSVGWCMPRYMRDRARAAGIATATSQHGASEPALADPRRDQQRDAAVDRDRCRGVARVVARVRPADGRGAARAGAGGGSRAS